MSVNVRKQTHTPLRILHLNTAREWRGGELQTLLLFKGLQTAGHKNVLVCPGQTPLDRKIRALGFPVYNLPLLGEYDIYSVIAIRNLITRLKIQVLHAHTAHAQLLGGMACLGLDCRCVASRRVDFHVRNALSLKVKYKFLTDGIIAVSDAVNKILIHDGIEPQKIITIYSGCDPSRFSAIRGNGSLRREIGIGKDTFVVLNVAALVPHKDQATLLHAANLLKDRYPRIQFLVAGDGMLRKQLIRQAGELGLEGIVTFLGRRDDIEELLAIADMFVLTSREEGLCTSLIDALFMRLPVVATHAGGIPEIIQNGTTGFLVPVGDYRAVAEKITVLMDDKKLRKRLSSHARSSAQEFHIDKTVERTEAYYRKLVYEHVS